jgi:hypothetical protein
MNDQRRKEVADYEYEVWRNGGNPNNVDPEDVPEDFDWINDKVDSKYIR